MTVVNNKHKSSPVEPIPIGASVVLDDKYRRSSKKIKKARRARCKVCKVWFTSKKALKEHEQGKAHQKKSRGVFENVRQCLDCDITVLSPKSLEQHLTGRVHLRRVAYVHRQKQLDKIEKEKKRHDKYTFLVALGNKHKKIELKKNKKK